MISTDYMQICHRHKSTAVHSLTFLFVTSKHFSVPLLSLLFGPEDKRLPFRSRTKHHSDLCSPVSHIAVHQITQCVWMFGYILALFTVEMNASLSFDLFLFTLPLKIQEAGQRF